MSFERSADKVVEFQRRNSFWARSELLGSMSYGNGSGRAVTKINGRAVTKIQALRLPA